MAALKLGAIRAPERRLVVVLFCFLSRRDAVCCVVAPVPSAGPLSHGEKKKSNCQFKPIANVVFHFSDSLISINLAATRQLKTERKNFTPDVDMRGQSKQDGSSNDRSSAYFR